ncbi:MAG: DUF4330 domain-containing protein [Oscillatoria sp. SIO1A7]|nr:DUF4330 domain-containing protein [Oscillatoria sp. SIO1A7]
MTILDSKGRLFGKVSVLDVGAALVILLVIAGIFVFPGPSGSGAIGADPKKPIEVDLIVRGLRVRDPDIIIQELETGKTNIFIRNQRQGEIGVKSIKRIRRQVVVPQPDGSVKALPDPRVEDIFSTDLLLTLTGKAEITPDGPVLGNDKLKIGTTVQLDGKTYNFNSSVIDVRVM